MIILVALLLIGGGIYWLTQRRARGNTKLAPVAAADPSALLAGAPAPPAGDPGQIVVSGLTKRYADVTAVDGLSFTVEAGRVTAFLGPNGAGKTTTLRVLLGLATPTAGDATIGGSRYCGLTRPIRRVGAVLEGSAAHRGRTGRDHLRIICRAGGVPLARADEVLALVGPEGIRWLRDLLRGLADQGRTVLVSSHLLAEVQALADDVVIIAAGRLVAHGSVESVLDSRARPARTLVRTPEPDRLVAELGDGAVVTSAAGGGIYLSGVDPTEIGDAARRALLTSPGTHSGRRPSSTCWPASPSTSCSGRPGFRGSTPSRPTSTRRGRPGS